MKNHVLMLLIKNPNNILGYGMNDTKIILDVTVKKY